VIIALQVTIYLNPKVVFNPLPPYDLPEALVLENPTQPSATLELLPTATSELVLTSTETRMPTATEQGTYSNGTPVPEITSLPPTETPF